MEMVKDLIVLACIFVAVLTLFLWMFRDRRSGTRTIVHPILGPIYQQNAGSWYREYLEPFGCGGRPDLKVFGGSTEPTDACVCTYQQLRSRWPEVAEQVAKAILSTNLRMSKEEAVNALTSTEHLWAYAELVSVEIFGDGDFTLYFENHWKDFWQDRIRFVETTHHFRNWQLAKADV